MRPTSASSGDDAPWAARYKNKGNEPIEKLSIVEGDGAYAGIVAEKYFHAIAVEDWKLACEQRLPEEREELARGVGSCATTYRLMIKSKAGGHNLDAFMTLHRVAARRRGKLIAVDVDSPARPRGSDDNRPFMTVLLGREGDGWYLIDLDDDQNF